MSSSTPAPLARALADCIDASGGKTPTAEALLDAFMAAMQADGTQLYPAQEEALLCLAEGNHVILATPTGSGKSLVASFHHFLSLGLGRRSYYTSPIKALVSEKFFALCRAFGADKVGMLTGDASVNRDAPIICATAEVLANMSVVCGGQAQQTSDGSAPQVPEIGDVIMDEFHYYGDAGRGTAWQLPLLTLPDTTFLLMSATLGDVTFIANDLQARSGRPVSHVQSDVRPVPLDFSYSEVPLQEALQLLVASKKTPVYVVHFSQREAIESAQNALSTDILTKAEKAEIQATIGGFRFDSPFGKVVRRLCLHGIGIHHAGLLPKYRLLVEKLAQSGLLRIIMGTDTLGVGINVPIRSVLLTKLCKYDGVKVGILPVRDFRQITGRAGRKGYDEAGSVVAQAPEHTIENRRAESRVAGDAKKMRKLVKKKPPAKNYVPWDAKTFEKLCTAPPEPLQSQFSLSHHLLLSVLRGHPRGYGGLMQILAACHERPRQKTLLRRQARHMVRTLLAAGVLVRWRSPNKRPKIILNELLGDDFSLTHALTLFLLDTLPNIPTEDPDYPLNVLSLVESILDSPDAILRRQVDVRKTEAMQQMRAEGVPYEERIAELDNIEHDKPLGEFLYAAFNQWTDANPWARDATLRPKSIARQLIEEASGFSAYINSYGLERHEGVLLRYLSQVHRALGASIPEGPVQDAMLDTEAYLRALIANVDGSLIEAWEAMSAPPTDAPVAVAAPAGPPATLRALWQSQPRKLAARLRAEMQQFVLALARGDWTAAHSAVLQPDEEAITAGEPVFDADRLAAVCGEVVAAHGTLSATPIVRQNHWTSIREETPQLLHITQTLVCNGEASDAVVQASVVLSDDPISQGPLIALQHIG